MGATYWTDENHHQESTWSFICQLREPTEIEGVMNDRPLTYVTSDSADPDPLTPAHLLYGRRITALHYANTIRRQETITKQSKLAK